MLGCMVANGNEETNVATHVRERRAKSGMDLKAAAKALRVPQYRLRDIEEREVDIDASVLYRYVDLLGLN